MSNRVATQLQILDKNNPMLTVEDLQADTVGTSLGVWSKEVHTSSGKQLFTFLEKNGNYYLLTNDKPFNLVGERDTLPGVVRLYNEYLYKNKKDNIT